MEPAEAIAAVARLAGIESRQDAARRLARQVGADALVLLVHNSQADLLLPAPGSRKTLPGGDAWREFVQRCRVPGRHRGTLPVFDGGAPAPAAACSNGEMALLFLGGSVEEADLVALAPTLPLLAAVLRDQQVLAICKGELAAAHFEMRQYASLTQALEEARSQVDRTVRELALQARRLDEARTRAEQAARAKDEFLAMLGHELRNPLAPIVTVLELLRRRGHWSHEHDIMQRQVQHLQRLVDDLLDVSRIAGGKLALERRVVELVEVARSAHETAHAMLAQKNQQLAFDVPASGLAVDADPERLSQVFANLLTNASKYSDPGTTVTLRARRAGGEVVVEVHDQGIGIRPGMLERVFELFEQESAGIDRAQGGLGLGLAIVRNLVRQHGGMVHAESDGLGKGSRFVVRLPLAEGVPLRDSRPREVAAQPAPCPHPGRVLLVDDNADALTTLSEALRLMGYGIEIAVDGYSALVLARTFRPDLALLDIGLPGMDGYALAGALRAELQPRPPKLVALTGYGQPGEKQRAVAAGFDAHLVKPVDVSHLHAVIARLLVAPP